MSKSIGWYFSPNDLTSEHVAESIDLLGLTNMMTKGYNELDSLLGIMNGIEELEGIHYEEMSQFIQPVMDKMEILNKNIDKLDGAYTIRMN